MGNEKFNQAVDEIIGYVLVSQKLQVDQLRNHIKVVHEANMSTPDINAIALQILETPVQITPQPADTSGCRGCTGCDRTHKIVSEDPVVRKGCRGNIQGISFVQNAAVLGEEKDYYHHCPEVQGKLVRLNHYEQPDMFKCPICSQVFE